MRKRITKEDIENSKSKINSLLKTNKKIEELDDEALYSLQLMIEKELIARNSGFQRPGSRRDLHLLD